MYVCMMAVACIRMLTSLSLALPPALSVSVLCLSLSLFLSPLPLLSLPSLCFAYAAGVAWRDCQSYTRPTTLPAASGSVSAGCSRCGSPTCKCNENCTCAPKNFWTIDRGVFPIQPVPSARK